MAWTPRRESVLRQLGKLEGVYIYYFRKLAFIQKLRYTYSRFTTIEYANLANSETEREKEERSIIWINCRLIIKSHNFYQFQNISDVWTLPLLPKNLRNIFPEQKQERTLKINVDSECVTFWWIFIIILFNFVSTETCSTLFAGHCRAV